MINMKKMEFLMLSCFFKMFYMNLYYIPCTLVCHLSVLISTPESTKYPRALPDTDAHSSLPLIPSHAIPPRTSCGRKIRLHQS